MSERAHVARSVQEIAQEIYDARGLKPIVAQVNTCAASAAYWIAAQADEIVVRVRIDEKRRSSAVDAARRSGHVCRLHARHGGQRCEKDCEQGDSSHGFLTLLYRHTQFLSVAKGPFT